jgi:hypothetical protein
LPHIHAAIFKLLYFLHSLSHKSILAAAFITFASLENEKRLPKQSFFIGAISSEDEMNTMVPILSHRSDRNEHHGGHFKPKLETITVVLTSEEINTTVITLYRSTQ